MKRGFWTGMTAGLLAAGLTGCVKNESGAGDGNGASAINFGITTESRTVVEDAADMTEFHVWAYRYDDTDFPSEVFTSQSVEKNAGGQWEYEPLRLWEEGYYVFGAFYPVPTSLGMRLIMQMIILKNGERGGGIAINHFECSAEGNEDLLIASHERNYVGTNGEAVVLDFKHLLSKVSICAKAAGTEEAVIVHSVEFTGMAMVGTYRYEDEEYDPDGTWSAWRGQGAEIGTFTTEENITLPANGESVDLLTDLLLIPQEVTVDFLVTLDCTVEGERKTLTATLPTQPAWEEGKAYRYTLTVRGDYITFEANVVPWNTSTGGIITVE